MLHVSITRKTSEQEWLASKKQCSFGNVRELYRGSFQGVNTIDILNNCTVRIRLSSEIWTRMISHFNRVFKLWHLSVMNVTLVFVVYCQYVSVPCCMYFV